MKKELVFMKAAFKKNHDVFLKDFELEPLKADEIRLKVDACGICGTDLHVSPSGDQEAFRFGHEIAGTVLEIGTSVTNVEKGQKVVLDSSTPCGYCDECRNARQELCRNVKSLFHLKSFGMAEEMKAPAISAIPYEGLSPEVASLQEPLGVAIDLVRVNDVSIDSNVLIMGAGPIGLMAACLVKKAGASKIFISDFKSKTARMSLAESIGIDGFVDPSECALAEYNFGCEIDRVLVTSPPKTLPSAFDVACKGAIISFIGIGLGDGAFCTFDVNKFHFKKLQLRASFASPALYGPKALKYLKDGVVDGEKFISHVFKLDQVDEAFKAAVQDDAVKVVVVNEHINEVR
jgi:threonine dehydrogenase-like Zn-dependent dehydrogenase